MAKTSGGLRYTHAAPSDDYKEFRAYGKDWEKTYFDHDTGGYVVTHRDRIESGDVSKQAKDIFKKEQDMCHDLAKQGHKIEHRSDKDRKRRDTYDITYDGKKADLKSIGSHNNIEKYSRHAIKEQGAKVVIFRIENGAKNMKKISEALRSAKRKYGHTILFYHQSDKIIREV